MSTKRKHNHCDLHVPNRRLVIVAIGCGALLVRSITHAQVKDEPRRVGILAFHRYERRLELQGPFALRNGLLRLGWTEGRNLSIENRLAASWPEMQVMAAELVASRMDVIVCVGPGASIAARDATKKIPLVMTVVDDPIDLGLVTNLAHPGGNITGLSLQYADLIGKWLELLREVAPRLVNVVALRGPGSYPKVEATASQLGLTLHQRDIATQGDIDDAFALAGKLPHCGAILIGGVFFYDKGPNLTQLALKHGVPTVAPSSELADAGILMSYGANMDAIFEQTAGYVDQILRRAQPGDLPIQQPTRIELVLNLKTAKALGLTFPNSLLVRAERIIR
jgi:putative tryptophan/tyrosine transport system substrate-binding protein